MTHKSIHCGILDIIGLSRPSFEVSPGKLRKVKKYRWQPIAIVLGSISILVFLIGKSFSIDLEEHQRYQKLFIHQFVHHENLNKNILIAKYQVFTSYDAINYSFDLLKEDYQKLRSIPRFIDREGQTQLRSMLDRQTQELQRKQESLERFKTRNAAIKNSLRYLPELKSKISNRVALGEIGDEIFNNEKKALEFTDILDRLLQNVLVYNLTSDRSIALKIAFNINQLEQFKNKYELRDLQSSIDLIMRHSQIILDGQYELNNLSETILDNHILKNSEEIEKLHLVYYEKAVKEASLYRFLSYAVSMAILSWISYLVIDRLLKINRRITQMNVNLEETLQELKQTQAQLIQTEKMSSLGQMVAGVAHEINNPISFIYSNITPASEYIKDLFSLIHTYQAEYPDPSIKIQELSEGIELDFIQEDLIKILTSMQSGADRIRTIVLSLRNFSRLDESDIKIVDIHEGIESTLVILQNQPINKSNNSPVSIIKHYGKLPQVSCYPSQLNQVFLNILNNAIYALFDRSLDRDNYSPEGNNLLEKFPDLQKTIFITTSVVMNPSNPQADRAVIRIRDNGVGIPTSIQSRLFDPFFTTKPVGKGTGLGLSISYQIIVEKHKGSLKCFSTPGEGTEFCIEIPIRLTG
jgi:signal transduction histidine kinase